MLPAWRGVLPAHSTLASRERRPRGGMATTVDADDGFVLVDLDGENSDPETPFNEPSAPSSAPVHSEAAAGAAAVAGTAAAPEAPYACPDLEVCELVLVTGGTLGPYSHYHA